MGLSDAQVKAWRDADLASDSDTESDAVYTLISSSPSPFTAEEIKLGDHLASKNTEVQYLKHIAAYWVSANPSITSVYIKYATNEDISNIDSTCYIQGGFARLTHQPGDIWEYANLGEWDPSEPNKKLALENAGFFGILPEDGDMFETFGHYL